MSGVGAAYITKQPRNQNQDIHNSFSLMGNEHHLRTWIFKEGTCECTGSYYTTLTDTRLLLRFEDSTCCKCCSSEANHHDASIFLRDIAEMRESTQGRDSCAHSCGKCCGCCGCCCNTPKYMELRGTFGSEILHVSKEDMPKAQVEIPAAIGNHKLVSQY
jgi:hypothetical protein